MRPFLHLSFQVLPLDIILVSLLDKLFQVVSNAKVLFLFYFILGAFDNSWVCRGRPIEHIRVNSQKTLVFRVFRGDRRWKFWLLQFGDGCALSIDLGVAIKFKIVSRVEIKQLLDSDELFVAVGVLIERWVLQRGQILYLVVALFGSLLNFMYLMHCVAD